MSSVERSKINPPYTSSLERSKIDNRNNLYERNTDETRLIQSIPREHFTAPIERYFNQAGIRGPLFPTSQTKELFEKTGSSISWLIPEAPMDISQLRPSFNRRHKALRQEAILANNLYFDSLNENSSELSEMIRCVVDYNTPSSYPRPDAYLTKENSPIDIYRTDCVPTCLNSNVVLIAVEDDTFPGGIGFSTAQHNALNFKTPAEDFAYMMKQKPISPQMMNEGFDRHHLTILRPRILFERPEHQLIKYFLKQHNIETTILNIEDIASSSCVAPGYVFVYGLTSALFRDSHVRMFDLLADPEATFQTMELNFSQYFISDCRRKADEHIVQLRKDTRKTLKDFTTEAVDSLINSGGVYPIHLFGDQAIWNKLKKLVIKETNKKNNLATALLERHGHDLHFFNNPKVGRIINSKINYALLFLPGFKESLYENAQTIDEKNNIDELYKTTAYTFPIIRPSTSIKPLDQWLNENLTCLRDQPDQWVIKVASDPTGSLDWGSRLIISGSDYKKMHKWNTLIEKILYSDLCFIAQARVPLHPFDQKREGASLSQKESLFLDGKEIGVYSDKGLVAYPSVLRISPYFFGEVVSQGVFTGERHRGATFSTVHGGSGSFIGPLII